MNAAALARRIKEKGVELGLGAVGIASVGPSAHAGFLKEWLLSGRAGEMGWMERTYEARVDLTTRFPWVRVAVVAAMPYLPYKDDRRGQAGLVADVARHPGGGDCHPGVGGGGRAPAAVI